MVRRATIVLVVTPKFRVEGFVLFTHQVVTMLAAPFGNGLKGPLQALLHRLDMDRELPSAASCTPIRESEKIEGCGPLPHSLRLLQGRSPKVHKAGLLRMECQPVFRKSLGKHLQHFLRILAVLKAEHGIIGIPDLKDLALQIRFHLILKPFVENIVKVDVGQQRTDYLPLPSPRLAHEQSPLVDDTHTDPLPYKAKDACVADPLLDHLDESLSHNRVKVRADVQL